MTTIVFLGIDLAKNVFALHGVNATGRAHLALPVNRWFFACWLGVLFYSGWFQEKLTGAVF